MDSSLVGTFFLVLDFLIIIIMFTDVHNTLCSAVSPFTFPSGVPHLDHCPAPGALMASQDTIINLSLDSPRVSYSRARVYNCDHS